MNNRLMEFVGEGSELKPCCLTSVVKSDAQHSGKLVHCGCGAVWHTDLAKHTDEINDHDMLPKGVIFNGFDEETIKEWFYNHKEAFRPVRAFSQGGTHFFPQVPDSWCKKEEQRILRLEKGIVAVYCAKTEEAPLSFEFPAIDTLKDEPGYWTFEGVEKEDRMVEGSPERANSNPTDARGFIGWGELEPAENHTHKFEGPLDMGGSLFAVSSRVDGHSHLVRVGATTPGEFRGTSSTDAGHSHNVMGQTGPTTRI